MKVTIITFIYQPIYFYFSFLFSLFSFFYSLLNFFTHNSFLTPRSLPLTPYKSDPIFVVNNFTAMASRMIPKNLRKI